MVDIKKIIEKVRNRQYEFSKHAVDQSIIRDISVSEVEQAIMRNAEIIEDYPNDKYGSSCLILGYTKEVRPLHIQCSYPGRPLIKLLLCINQIPNFGSVVESVNPNEERVDYERDYG